MNQTYKDYKVIVSIDHPSCEAMLKGKDVKIIHVLPEPEKGECFYNLYCNDLKRAVVDGWGLFMDSDDYLAGNDSLERISNHLNEDERYRVVICQMSRSFGRIKPTDSQMDNRQVVSGKIGLPCIIFHHSVKNVSMVGPNDNSDYAFIKEMKQLCDTKFVKQVVVHSPKRNFGK